MVHKIHNGKRKETETLVDIYSFNYANNGNSYIYNHHKSL